MVFSSSPVICASKRSPPVPMRLDSTATYQRRCCSSSRREPQIHLPMQLLIRMRCVLLAMQTLTVMHLCSRHSWFPSSVVFLLAYSTSSLLVSPAQRLERKLFFNEYLVAVWRANSSLCLPRGSTKEVEPVLATWIICSKTGTSRRRKISFSLLANPGGSVYNQTSSTAYSCLNTNNFT